MLVNRLLGVLTVCTLTLGASPPSASRRKKSQRTARPLQSSRPATPRTFLNEAERNFYTTCAQHLVTHIPPKESGCEQCQLCHNKFWKGCEKDEVLRVLNAVKSSQLELGLVKVDSKVSPVNESTGGKNIGDTNGELSAAAEDVSAEIRRHISGQTRRTSSRTRPNSSFKMERRHGSARSPSPANSHKSLQERYNQESPLKRTTSTRSTVTVLEPLTESEGDASDDLKVTSPSSNNPAGRRRSTTYRKEKLDQAAASIAKRRTTSSGTMNNPKKGESKDSKSKQPKTEKQPGEKKSPSRTEEVIDKIRKKFSSRRNSKKSDNTSKKDVKTKSSRKILERTKSKNASKENTGNTAHEGISRIKSSVRRSGWFSKRGRGEKT